MVSFLKVQTAEAGVFHSADSLEMHKVVIIGSGQVGQTLGRLLNNSGKYQVCGVCDRKLKNAQAGARFIGAGARVYKNKAKAAEQADIIFITTPDSVIEQVCREIFSG